MERNGEGSYYIKSLRITKQKERIRSRLPTNFYRSYIHGLTFTDLDIYYVTDPFIVTGCIKMVR